MTNKLVFILPMLCCICTTADATFYPFANRCVRPEIANVPTIERWPQDGYIPDIGGTDGEREINWTFADGDHINLQGVAYCENQSDPGTPVPDSEFTPVFNGVCNSCYCKIVSPFYSSVWVSVGVDPYGGNMGIGCAFACTQYIDIVLSESLAAAGLEAANETNMCPSGHFSLNTSDTFVLTDTANTCPDGYTQIYGNVPAGTYLMPAYPCTDDTLYNCLQVLQHDTTGIYNTGLNCD